MKEQKKKVIVIISGGLDSSVLIHYVHKVYNPEIYALSFIFNKQYIKEIECAKIQTKIVNCVEHKIIDVSFLKELTNSFDLNDEVKVCKEEDVSKIRYFPNKNMVMLSIATTWAESINANKVFYGAHLTDAESVYLDCRFDFINTLSKATSIATYNKIEIVAPFALMHKKDIVELGSRLGIDFSKTWSCYTNNAYPCGICFKCKERIKAFQEIGIEDPLNIKKS